MSYRNVTCAALGLLIGLAQSAVAGEPNGQLSSINGELAKAWPDLESLYKDIHAHPELSLHETRTAATLAAEMRKLGFEVTEAVGGTGIVALYRNGAGPVLMVRTELDALPMEEKTGLAFASHVKAPYNGGLSSVAHSCGHDNHMAWWVGTAETLIALREQWHGTLMFVGQEGEEAGDGAHKMIADGLFTRFPKPDYAIAAHVGNAPAGRVTVKEGAVSSNSDAVEIIFKGRGAHGSRPSASIDPVVMGAHFVTDVQTVISREKNAGAFGVVTVGSFQAGTAGNIIPDQADLKLTLRSYDPEVRQLLLDGVDRTATAIAAMARAPAPEIMHRGGTASVVNEPPMAKRAFEALKPALGDQVRFVPKSEQGGSASEDFSAYGLEGVSSLYLGIGGYDPAVIADYEKRGEPVPTNHSPFFAPDYKVAIETGVRALSLVSLNLLQIQSAVPASR
ncbi:amidohydrolase [Bradyrhizobium genosp. P]|uniref:amidohydrolase n=1 Tax=Bradyrhizobium genosp. P TaxID=83641 RepID=UPI003CF6312F